MTRLQFLRLRSIPTAVSLVIVVALVRLAWYPGEYLGLAGIAGLVWLMVGVNLVLGPALTSFVFRPGKRGLRFDIAAIAAVEALALGLMVTSLYERRPAFTVFAVDRFEVVTWPEIDDPRVAANRIGRRRGLEPRLAFAELPTDPDVFDRLLEETVLLGLPDIDRRAEFWLPYAAGLPVLKSRAQPLGRLLDGEDGRSGRVERWLRRASGDVADYAYLPIRGRKADAAMVLHADIGYPVAILPVDPW